MYDWRKISEEERAKAMEHRRVLRRPMHGPPHELVDRQTFHVTAACYEHRAVIGANPERINAFSREILDILEATQASIHAWCILPNHYHLLIATPSYPLTAKALGRIHGRTSRRWNEEDDTRGRKVWHRHADRAIRSDAHYWATTNYIHHNPVRHGYVERWRDWPWSSANQWLLEAGETEAARIWREFPVLDFGKGWDDP